MEELLEKLVREKDSHKGENGRVGVIAGSRDYTGAPALSAKAALRSGCDLVKILTSDSVREVVAGYSENFIVDSYPGDYFDESGLEKARELEEWSDALVIGPGLGEADPDAVKSFVSKTEKPVVIDADAIEPALEAEVSKAVFTPHTQEAGLIEEKFGSIKEFVERTGAVVVVKGSTDRIYTSEGVFENQTGHPAMTVGGTGDVLTGLIASLISQGLSLEEATRLGTWINGKAGEEAAEEYGNGALAADIMVHVPEIIGR